MQIACCEVSPARGGAAGTRRHMPRGSPSAPPLRQSRQSRPHPRQAELSPPMPTTSVSFEGACRSSWKRLFAEHCGDGVNVGPPVVTKIRCIGHTDTAHPARARPPAPTREVRGAYKVRVVWRFCALQLNSITKPRAPAPGASARESSSTAAWSRARALARAREQASESGAPHAEKQRAHARI